MTFEQELTQLINKHSQENASNTPDFILSTYLTTCLAAFAVAMSQRDHWYGVHHAPGSTAPIVMGSAEKLLAKKMLADQPEPL